MKTLIQAMLVYSKSILKKSFGLDFLPDMSTRAILVNRPNHNNYDKLCSEVSMITKKLVYQKLSTSKFILRIFQSEKQENWNK